MTPETRTRIFERHCGSPPRDSLRVTASCHHLRAGGRIIKGAAEAKRHVALYPLLQGRDAGALLCHLQLLFLLLRCDEPLESRRPHAASSGYAT
jgi:hypothetical protein